MITTFGVTATTGSRPIAVVAPMCHRPLANHVKTSPHRPCNDHGANVVVLPTPETTTTTLKDLTAACSGDASSNSVQEAPVKNPATAGSHFVPTLRTPPLRISLPNTVLKASLLESATQRTSVLGTQGTSVLGTSSLGFPCSEMTLTRSGPDSGATSRECCQFESRTTKDRRPASVLGHPSGDKTWTDVADGLALSLGFCTFDSDKTKDHWSDAILKQSTVSSVFLTPSSQSGDPLLALYPEPKDLSRAVEECNFYYGNMTNTEAKSRLHRCSVGTFLLRDSSDSRFRYSLSVKTVRGTTSIRIMGTSTGQYRLDSDPHQESRMPAFRWILSLVEHYFLSASSANSSTEKGRHRGHCVLLESSGRYDTPMVLRKPLELSPAPLAHLCRRTINNLVPSSDHRRKLIDSLVVEVDSQRRRSIQEYMIDYPFRV